MTCEETGEMLVECQKNKPRTEGRKAGRGRESKIFYSRTEQD